jgi:hypothetical protein
MPLVLAGATSGSATLQSTDATTTTITLPAATSTLYGSAGTVITSATAQASTSGTSIDFTSIPSWVKRITVMFSGVSTSGTSNLLVRLGYSGGIETTNYVTGSVYVGGANTSNTTGFLVNFVVTAATNISVTICFTTLGSNLWTGTGIMNRSDGVPIMCAGNKTTTGTLDRVSITTANGTDTFDAGTINIQYE